jgi:hypothetical protein
MDEWHACTKHVSEDQALEQWFLVAVGDDDKATDALTKATNASEQIVEIVGHIPASDLGYDRREVRLVLPGEPINSRAELKISETDDAPRWMFLWGSSG